MRRALVLSLAFLGSHAGVASAQPIVGSATVSPHVVVVGQPSPLTFQVSIPSTTVIPTGVNLVRVSATGAASTIGSFHDDGAAGDAVAGDGVFTWQGTVAESSLGQVRYQVSAAFRGTLVRVRRDFPAVFVQPPNAAEAIVAALAADLIAGTTVTVPQYFADSGRMVDLFSRLSLDDVKRIGASFQAARLVDSPRDRRIFRMPWTLGGQPSDLEFTVGLGLLGNWLIVSW